MYCFCANLLAMLLRPSLEKPVDSPQDILDKGMTTFVYPISGIYIDVLRASPNPVHNQVAKKSIITKDYADMMNMLAEDVQGAGTHAFLHNELYPDMKKLGYYHKSKTTLEAGMSPYLFWLVNKRWPMADELAVHLLKFQQVCIIILFTWFTRVVPH